MSRRSNKGFKGLCLAYDNYFFEGDLKNKFKYSKAMESRIKAKLRDTSRAIKKPDKLFGNKTGIRFIKRKKNPWD
jgi:hypothetical protein